VDIALQYSPLHNTQHHLLVCTSEKCAGFASDAEEKEYSMLMLQALSVAVRLDKFPKSTVDVDVLVLQNDGGLYYHTEHSPITHQALINQHHINQLA
jgi:hypothetical protein